MLADPLWFSYSLSLLDGSLDRNDEMAFCHAMNALSKYVIAKNNGRCTSKSLFDEDERMKMIKKLFDLYHRNESAATLCKSRFMRKLIKHNKDNDENIKFIYDSIVPGQAKMAKNPEAILSEPAALLWMSELDATVCDPVTLRNQRAALQEVPTELRVMLTEGRRRIGENLVSSVSKGWLDVEKLGLIIQGIISNDCATGVIELSEETAVDHFVQRYLALIASGGDYESAFRNSLLFGLNNLKTDPIFTKK